PPSSLGDGWTWDALREMIPLLSRDTDGDGEIDRFGAHFSSSILRTAAAVHQAGGAFYERDLDPRESRLNTPEVRTGLGFYAEIMASGYATNSGSTADLYGNR